MRAEIIKARSCEGLPPYIRFRMRLVNDSDLKVVVVGCQTRLMLMLQDHYAEVGLLQTDILSGTLQPRGKTEFYSEWHPHQHQLKLIEDRRAGGDLKFRMSLSVSKAEYTASNEVDLQRLNAGGTINVGDSEGSIDLEIPKSKWIQILEDVGYRRYIELLLEIPPPPGDELFSACVDHLKKARKNIGLGHYEDAATSSRRAINHIEKLVDNKTVDLATLFGENRKDHVIRVINAAKGIMSGPAHTQLLDYAGAEFALFLSTNIVNYVMREYAMKST